MKLKLLGVVSLGLLMGFAAAAVIVDYYYPNTGSIASLTMYLDATLYPNGTSIDWGTCEPDSTYFFENMTVVNTGSTPLTVYITPVGLPVNWTLTWAGNNTLVDVGLQVEGNLTLTIPASATTWPSWGFYLRGD